jgi:hypothetical protein
VTAYVTVRRPQRRETGRDNRRQRRLRLRTVTPQEVLKTGQSTAASQSVTLFRTLRSTAPMHHVSGALTGGAGACAGGTPRSGTKAALGSSADRSYSPSSGITGHQGSPATLRTASRHVDLESPFEFESPGAPNEGWHCARILSVRGSSGSLYLSSGALSAFRRSSHASAHHGARSAHSVAPLLAARPSRCA